jgi:hypothetical protein
MQTIVVGSHMYVASLTDVGIFELPSMTRVSTLPFAGVTHFAANGDVYACLNAEVWNLTTNQRLGAVDGTVTAFTAIDGGIVYGRKHNYEYWLGIIDQDGFRETPMPDVVHALSGDKKRYAVGCEKQVTVYENDVGVFQLNLERSVVCVCLKDNILIFGTAVPKQSYAACCVVNLADNTVSYPMYGKPPDRVIAVACGDGAFAYSTKDSTTVITDTVLEMPLYGNQLFLARECFVVVSDTNICIQAF